MSVVTYKTANTVPAGGPSPIIWADCPVIAMQKDPGKGIHFMEDFLGAYTNLTATGVLVGTPFTLVDDGGDGIEGDALPCLEVVQGETKAILL